MIKKLLFLLIPFLSLSQSQIGQDIIGEASNNECGYSVSLSNDGSIVAIGARYNGYVGSIYQAPGHVRIYENQNGIWTQIGNDINGETIGDQSGSSVSLSSDGTIVAIGAPNNYGVNGFSSGHVRVYENQSGSWTQIGDDIDGEQAGDRSGVRVSLSNDGSIVAISALGNNENGSNSGHVRVFKNQNGIWTQIGNDIDGEATYYQTGNSISLSSDGTILAIETIGNNDNSGQIRVYENQGGSWIQIGADIVREDTDEDSDGSISLSSDGTIIAIGAKYNDGINGINSGHVRVYENQGGSWTQIGNDIDGEAEGDLSGNSVSLSSDGTIVAIGAYYNSGNGLSSGHVRVYKNQGGSWTQIGDDMDGEDASDLYGYSVSLSSDGSIVASGAIHNAGNGNDSGQVRIYDLSDLLSLEDQKVSDFNLFPNPTKHQFTIQLNEASTLEQVSIYNTLGQEVLTSKNTIVDTSTLASGSYIVEITTNKGKASKKLIIE